MANMYSRYEKVIGDLAELLKAEIKSEDTPEKTVTEVYDIEKDKKMVLDDPMMLEYACSKVKTDREVVKETVSKNGTALRFAADELRDDECVVYQAMKQDISALQFASSRLRSDKDFIRRAIEKNYSEIGRCLKEGKSDEAFRLFISNYSVLNYVSYELRGDRCFVYSILAYIDPAYTNIFLGELYSIGNEKHWHPLEHLNYKLRDDDIIVFTALKLNMSGFEYASPRIQRSLYKHAC